MSTAANRGKSAEATLKRIFSAYSDGHSNFCFERVLDAHSARGAISSPRTGDFVLYWQGRNAVIELKTVAHDYRLPKANFGLDQRARMKIRELAGSTSLVVVYHSTTDLLRVLPLSYFGTETTGSWDLRETEALASSSLLEQIFYLATTRSTNS